MATATLWLQVVIKQQETASVLLGRCPQIPREGRGSLVRTLGYGILGLQWARLKSGLCIRPTLCNMISEVPGPSEWATITSGTLRTQIQFSLYFYLFFQSLLYFHRTSSLSFLENRASWFFILGKKREENLFPFIKVSYWIHSVYGRQQHPGTSLTAHSKSYVVGCEFFLFFFPRYLWHSNTSSPFEQRWSINPVNLKGKQKKKHEENNKLPSHILLEPFNTNYSISSSQLFCGVADICSFYRRTLPEVPESVSV